MKTEAQKELDILQTAKQTVAYLEGVALLHDVDPVAVANFVSYTLKRRADKEREAERMEKN